MPSVTFWQNRYGIGAFFDLFWVQIKITPKMKYTFSSFALLALATVFFAWTTPPSDAWQQKVDATLLVKAKSQAQVDFVVLFAAKPDLSAARSLSTKTEKGAFVYQSLRASAEQSQAATRLWLRERSVKHQSFYLVNAIHTKGGLDLIQALAERSEVRQLIANPSVQLDLPEQQNVADYRSPEDVEWGIAQMGADQVWNMGYRGEGVTVAGEDTGYEWRHPALINAYRGWDGSTATHDYHWHDAIHFISPLHGDPAPDPSLNPCGVNSLEPCDDNNHGTHTMGTMIGEDGNNQIGVAPDAKWMACRNMERGYGSPTTYIECFEFFLAPTDLQGENPRPEMAPHVINNSWSCPEIEGCNASNWNLMDEAVNNLKAAGIVVVVSAGNSGPGCESVSTPAAMLENSFTVGATNSSDGIAGFSSRGPVTADGSGRAKPDISAPGVAVRSAVRNGNYSSFNGTSMAGPHVAGLVALLISANPNLAGQVDLIEDIIKSSAVPRTTTQECGGIPGSEIPNNTFGYGRIDAVAAIEAALTVTSTAPQPTELVRVAVAPNPFSETTTLTLEGLTGPTQVRVFDAAGRELWAQRVEADRGQVLTLPLAEQAPGLYFYRVESGARGFYGKLLKQ